MLGWEKYINKRSLSVVVAAIVLLFGCGVMYTPIFGESIPVIQTAIGAGFFSFGLANIVKSIDWILFKEESEDIFKRYFLANVSPLDRNSLIEDKFRTICYEYHFTKWRDRESDEIVEGWRESVLDFSGNTSSIFLRCRLKYVNPTTSNTSNYLIDLFKKNHIYVLFFQNQDYDEMTATAILSQVSLDDTLVGVLHHEDYEKQRRISRCVLSTTRIINNENIGVGAERLERIWGRQQSKVFSQLYLSENSDLEPDRKLS